MSTEISIEDTETKSNIFQFERCDGHQELLNLDLKTEMKYHHTIYFFTVAIPFHLFQQRKSVISNKTRLFLSLGACGTMSEDHRFILSNMTYCSEVFNKLMNIT